MNYEFHLSARPYLTSLDISNPWIWKSCKHVVNVSLKDQPDEIKELIQSKGATYDWIPITENEDFDNSQYLSAVAKVLGYCQSSPNDEIIVHCTGGNNRSRLVCEAVIYALTGTWPQDQFEVDGVQYESHTDYNIRKGYLKI